VARRGPDGRIYVSDFNNQRLRAIGEDGLVTTVAGSGWHSFAFAGEPALDSPLENPIDLAFLPSGELAFVQLHDPRVLRIDQDGILQIIAGTGDIGVTGDEGDGGPALAAQFMELAGLAVAPDGTVFVADDLANRVRVIRDGMIDTYAGTGLADFSGDGGPATEAGLNHPTALDLDAEGNLYIADYSNGAVRRVTPAGIITTVVGPDVLAAPDGVAVGADGTLYVSDRDAHVIRRVDPGGAVVTIAGTGERGFGGNAGPAALAQLDFPARITLDGDSLLVADQANSCIRRIVLAP
jgi:serine/threonine-protein kinase